ncbi:MBL fold metallo-hydrolase [Nocardia sp. NPDC049707]|uniref:MBL fold metallo-hydrolase n=1 Tax=Nocardia sp. NPDC049707 TaxID=3154735 RepID=UPI0034224EB9
MTFETTVGHARIRQVTERARWAFSPTEIFPGVTASQISSAATNLGPACIDEDSHDLILAIHTYVIELGNAIIVVDTGNGNGRHRPNLLAHHMFDTDYLDRLTKIIDLSAVTAVVNTHLHPDHCGWNTHCMNGVWVPTFPQANYLFREQELASLRSIVESGPVNGVEEDLVRMFEDSIRPVLTGARYATYRGQYTVAEFGDTTVVSVPSPGHTGGHSTIEVRSPRGTAVMSGDVIHHPIQLTHSALCAVGDSNPSEAARVRVELLERAATGDVQLLTSHFPVDGPLRIRLLRQDSTRQCFEVVGR